MIEIPLTQGKFAMIDDEDFEKVSGIKWYAYLKRTNSYAKAKIRTNGILKTIGMHRIIMEVSDKNIQVDHIDMNGLNNCKSNLRLCTNAQNACNKKSRENSFSKYLGVSVMRKIYKNKNNIIVKYLKFRAELQTNNKRIYLGLFENEIEAAKAYNLAAEKYHGEFARKNFI